VKQQLTSFILFTGVFIVGCANMQQEQTLKDIKSHLSELEKAQSKTSAGMEELNNKFFLLQEQTAANKKNIDEIKTMAVPVAPPEELKVVKLEAEGIKRGSASKDDVEKKSSTKKSSYAPDPEALYNEAQNLFMAGRLSESAEQFNKFIQYHPKHSLADNAQYWVGETYYSKKDYQKAAMEFQKTVDNYPNENKAPDALLKVGFSYLELNNMDKALAAFKAVIEKYPSSDAVVKARERLQEFQK
jgi:tol-pal system protein YbgF